VPTTLPPSVDLRDDLAELVQHRTGIVEVAVENLGTDQTFTFGPNTPQDEASVVKVNILTALLAMNKQPLSASEKVLAQEMIEVSDNDAATQLWNTVGANRGIAVLDGELGMTSTTPSPCVVCADFPWPGWGLTTTTPTDQLKLLHAIFIGGAGLSIADRTYVLQLMKSVIPSERWGVSSGVPDSVSVALKNGWLPLNSSDTDWQINSIGWVRGDGRDYLVAMLSTGNPSEEYGIQTLDNISALIWRYSHI
jgi:beta-lactamase class A